MSSVLFYMCKSYRVKIHHWRILYHLHWTLLLHAYSIYEMHRIVHASERNTAAMEEMEIFLDIPGGQMNNTQWLIQYHALYMQQTKGSSVCHLPLHLTCMLCLPLTAPSLTCWQIVLSAWWKPKILSRYYWLLLQQKKKSYYLLNSSWQHSVCEVILLHFNKR